MRDMPVECEKRRLINAAPMWTLVPLLMHSSASNQT